MSLLRHIFSVGLGVCLLAGAVHGVTPAGPWEPAQLDFFETKVRPVFAEHCFGCHSARADKLKGGLHLDSREGLLKGGDSGMAVVPGEPGKSRLVEAVRYGNQDTAMPPKGKLPEAIVADLERWVEMGAPWPPEVATPAGGGARTGPDFARLQREHWAYQPSRAPAVPVVSDATWARNDVDRFILAALEQRSLQPAADADRATLARRIYFDLIGLPPTPEQIDNFVNDASADAYPKLVDQLLASPLFGERWGRHWLDVTRYGESLTLRGFVLKDAWRFRDYVIEAFNEDRPFNIVMQEHVAGDLMPVPSEVEGPADSVAQRRRQMTGTTFLALGNTNLEEQDKKLLRMDVVDEQLDTIGKAFLGQTIGCARCHDHKFDPIPAADYYAMAGILRSTKAMEHANVSKWMEVPLPEEPAREAELQKHEAAVAALQAKLKDTQSALAKLTTKDGDRLAQGKRPNVVAVKDLPGVVVDDEAAKRVGEWKHSTTIATYIGDGYLHDMHAGKGEKTLTFQPELPHTGRYEVRLSYMPSANRATNVPVTILSEEGERTLTVNQRTPPLIDGRFVSLGVYRFVKDGQGYVLVSNEGTDGHVVADAVQFLPADDVTVAVADPAAVIRLDDERARSLRDEVSTLQRELKALTDAGPKRQTIVSVFEEDAKEIGDTQIHIRGIPQNLGATVPRGFLTAIPVRTPPEISPGQSGRLELARWLAHPDNPLPPRVMANRVWHWLMGQGIVRTVDNFGTTGEPPSHPELLEHLASRFVAEGWSVKKLVRTVVLSRTYQLSSASDEKALAIDPENRLRWRMDRRRLDAECIRDAMLSVSGTLDLTPGGPGFKPDQAADYGFRHTDARRSVYSPVFRNALPEVFEAFDFADPSAVVGRRTASTVAPQALFLMNHPFPRGQAEAAADRLLAEAGFNDGARLTLACRLALGRPPAPGERQVLMRFVEEVSEGDPAQRRAAWADVVHTLFASPDFRHVN